MWAGKINYSPIKIARNVTCLQMTNSERRNEDVAAPKWVDGGSGWSDVGTNLRREINPPRNYCRLE